MVMTEEEDRCDVCGELYYDHSTEHADECLLKREA